jgi:hypothetical protein
LTKAGFFNIDHSAIVDSRTAFEILRGTAIPFAFGTEKVVKTWKPMTLPKSQAVQKKIADMENILGINVNYIEES